MAPDLPGCPGPETGGEDGVGEDKRISKSY